MIAPLLIVLSLYDTSVCGDAEPDEASNHAR